MAARCPIILARIDSCLVLALKIGVRSRSFITVGYLKQACRIRSHFSRLDVLFTRTKVVWNERHIMDCCRGSELIAALRSDKSVSRHIDALLICRLLP